MKRALPWAAAFSLFVAAMANAQTLPSPAAESCLSCHGPRGNPGPFPDLARLDANALVQQMAEFRAGARAGTIMNRIAKGYSDAESRAVADELVAYLHEAKP